MVVGVGAELEDLVHAVEVAGKVDPTGLPTSALGDAVEALERVRRTVEAVEAGFVDTWNLSGAWRDEARSPATALKARTHMSDAVAGRRFRHGRCLRTMPITADAYRDGLLGEDHLNKLIEANSGRTAEFFADEEETLVGHAIDMGFADFAKAVSYWMQVVDQDGPEPDDLDEDHGSLNAGEGLNGTTEVHGTLPALGGYEYRRELDRLRAGPAAARGVDFTPHAHPVHYGVRLLPNDAMPSLSANERT